MDAVNESGHRVRPSRWPSMIERWSMNVSAWLTVALRREAVDVR